MLLTFLAAVRTIQGFSLLLETLRSEFPPCPVFGVFFIMKGNQSILNNPQGENLADYENSDGAEDVLSANNVGVYGCREGEGTWV